MSGRLKSLFVLLFVISMPVIAASEEPACKIAAEKIEYQRSKETILDDSVAEAAFTELGMNVTRNKKEAQYISKIVYDYTYITGFLWHENYYRYQGSLEIRKASDGVVVFKKIINGDGEDEFKKVLAKELASVNFECSPIKKEAPDVTARLCAMLGLWDEKNSGHANLSPAVQKWIDLNVSIVRGSFGNLDKIGCDKIPAEVKIKTSKDLVEEIESKDKSIEDQERANQKDVERLPSATSSGAGAGVAK